MQKWFSDGQGDNKKIQKFLKFFRYFLGSARGHPGIMFRWFGVILCFFFQKFLKSFRGTLFRSSLESQGLRDPPCVKEGKNLFRIALTRALYDQMAPSYAHFTFQKKLRSHYGVILGHFRAFARIKSTEKGPPWPLTSQPHSDSSWSLPELF